ncbi:MAG: NAD-dependent epimerase/dehydratase family protein [Bacteroidales bacterium]|nr:NAD-dependent epimerase/dehydratase family protein [Bacteroidales bacterium]
MSEFIVIIGTESFIGNHILKNLIDYNFKEFDIKNDTISSLNLENVNTIIHLAAIVHQTKSILNSEYFRVNSDLAFETAKEAKIQGVKHFVFFSTIKVYGDGGYDDLVYNEKSICKPTDSYGKSKLDAEKRINSLADEIFKVSIIRPSMVYGKGVKANMLLLSKLIQKLPLIPFGNIKNKRAMVSIDNLMITLDAILNKKETGVYLACDRKVVSTTQLVETLMKILERNKKLIKLPIFIQFLIKFIFPHQSRRLFGSFNVDASATHSRLQINEKLIDLETGLKKAFER